MYFYKKSPWAKRQERPALTEESLPSHETQLPTLLCKVSLSWFGPLGYGHRVELGLRQQQSGSTLLIPCTNQTDIGIFFYVKDKLANIHDVLE